MIEEILPPPVAVREAFADRLLTDGLPAVNGQRLTGFAGRFLVRQGLIVTAIVIERDPCPPALFPRPANCQFKAAVQPDIIPQLNTCRYE